MLSLIFEIFDYVDKPVTVLVTTKVQLPSKEQQLSFKHYVYRH